MMRRAAPLLLALLLGAAANASAQAGSCNLIESQQVERDQLNGVINITGPFLVRCEGGAELRAQRGTLNEFSRELVLNGNVYFQDPDQTLTAENATYTSTIGRLYATENVVFTNRREGSTIRGPELEYFRPMEGRPDAMVNAGQRPHLTLQPKQASENAEPLEIDADRVSIHAQRNLGAYGNVVIKRTDLDATASEAQYDAETEGLELRGNAKILSERFTLEGEVIQADMADGALQHVQARNEAVLRGEELTVNAPELQMFFESELLHRAVARGGGEGSPRPVAVARNFRLEADSIDALTPAQKLDQVIAIGKARGEAMDTTRADSTAAPADSVAAPAEPTRTAAADTAAAEASDSALVLAQALISKDWIVGDTLIGYFEAPDSAARAESATADTAAVLKRIVARGAAQSLYRVVPRDTSAAQPGARRGLNYLAGEIIELTFEGGELNVAQVTGLRRGLYLDPAVAAAGGTPPGGAGAAPGSTTPQTPRREDGTDEG